MDHIFGAPRAGQGDFVARDSDSLPNNTVAKPRIDCHRPFHQPLGERQLVQNGLFVLVDNGKHATIDEIGARHAQFPIAISRRYDALCRLVRRNNVSWSCSNEIDRLHPAVS